MKNDAMNKQWDQGGYREGIASHGKGGSGGLSEQTSGSTFVPGTNVVGVSGGVVNETGDEPYSSGEVQPIKLNNRGEQVMSDFDPISEAGRKTEINPDHLVKKPSLLFIDETNVAAATYRVVLDFNGYDNATVNVICAGGVTVDIFGSNNALADDTADTGWVSLSATSIVDNTDGWVINGQEPWAKLMIKYVTSDASNSIAADANFGG